MSPAPSYATACAVTRSSNSARSAARSSNRGGSRQTADIGAIVYLLIESGAFFGSETDSPADFESVFDFVEAFDRPFMPRRSAAAAG